MRLLGNPASQSLLADSERRPDVPRRFVDDPWISCLGNTRIATLHLKMYIRLGGRVVSRLQPSWWIRFGFVFVFLIVKSISVTSVMCFVNSHVNVLIQCSSGFYRKMSLCVSCCFQIVNLISTLLTSEKFSKEREGLIHDGRRRHIDCARSTSV